MKNTPKTAYFQAKEKGERCPELEGVLSRPYNTELKKFVSDPDEHDYDMFRYGIAYLRQVLKRSPEKFKREYREKLERQLLRHFHPFCVNRYSLCIGGRLPDALQGKWI